MSTPLYVYVATHGSKVAHVKRADGRTVCGLAVTGRWRTLEQGKHGEAHDPHGRIAHLCASCWRMRDADTMILAQPETASIRFASLHVEGDAASVGAVLDVLRGPFVDGEGS